MAADVDIRPTSAEYPYGDKMIVRKLRARYDSSVTGQNLAQNEVAALLTIKAGTVILGGFVQVVTAQADVTDVDLGVSTTGATNDSIANGVSMAAAGYVFTAGMTGPIMVTADTQLVLTNKDADTMDTAVVDVVLAVADIRD